MGNGVAGQTLPATDPELTLKMLQLEEDCDLFDYMVIEELSTNWNSMEELQHVEDKERMTKISFADLELESVPKDADLASICAINMSGNNLTMETLTPLLSKESSLLQLNLSSNPNMFSAPFPEGFKLGCINILHLDVSFIDMTPEKVSFLLAPLQSILRLDAETCELTSLPVLPKTLTALNVKDNSIESLPGDLPLLTSLDLRSNPIESIPNYKARILSLLPLTNLDGQSTSIVSTANPPDLKPSVSSADSLQDSTSHLIPESEFHAALTNKIDSTVVS